MVGVARSLRQDRVSHLALTLVLLVLTLFARNGATAESPAESDPADEPPPATFRCCDRHLRSAEMAEQLLGLRTGTCSKLRPCRSGRCGKASGAIVEVCCCRWPVHSRSGMRPLLPRHSDHVSIVRRHHPEQEEPSCPRNPVDRLEGPGTLDSSVGCSADWRGMDTALVQGLTIWVQVIGAGYGWVLPLWHPEVGLMWLVHTCATIILSCSTFYNFGVTVQSDAGVAPPIPFPAEVGHLKAYTHCSRCDKGRPPRAHHCSSCKQCTLDLDHHCVFVNNCVGRANMRPFMLFLGCGLTGVTYVFIFSVLGWPIMLDACGLEGFGSEMWWIVTELFTPGGSTGAVSSRLWRMNKAMSR